MVNDQIAEPRLKVLQRGSPVMYEGITCNAILPSHLLQVNHFLQKFRDLVAGRFGMTRPMTTFWR
jgi:hypothetical protein